MSVREIEAQSTGLRAASGRERNRRRRRGEKGKRERERRQVRKDSQRERIGRFLKRDLKLSPILNHRLERQMHVPGSGQQVKLLRMEVESERKDKSPKRKRERE